MNGLIRQLKPAGTQYVLNETNAKKNTMKHPNVIFNGTGSYIPENIVTNSAFLNHQFFTEDKQPFDIPNELIIEKFEKITGIKERRYASNHQLASDLATEAAKKALEKSTVSGEELDYIIVAHNFGDVEPGTNRMDNMPGLAAKVKGKLGLQKADIVCFDVLFGCPGWVQGCIQAFQMIQSGFCRHIMVIGADTLSRIVDPHDRDSMIFADGAGAVILSATNEDEKRGILGFANRTDAQEELSYLAMGASLNSDHDPRARYIKMKGRKIYEYALNLVADGIQSAMKRSNVFLEDISKILIHQANEKMDEAILRKLGQLYNMVLDPRQLMPMTIGQLGNSSVATVPTMLDLIIEGKLDHHRFQEGDQIILASVGAGMHINAIVYRF